MRVFTALYVLLGIGILVESARRLGMGSSRLVSSWRRTRPTGICSLTRSTAREFLQHDDDASLARG
jgi:hypothetical protein